jgi:hypothetical protein
MHVIHKSTAVFPTDGRTVLRLDYGCLESTRSAAREVHAIRNAVTCVHRNATDQTAHHHSITMGQMT